MGEAYFGHFFEKKFKNTFSCNLEGTTGAVIS